MTTLNIQVCPLHPGDVCLSFDASETTNYLITGTMSGKIYVFDNSHVFSLLSLTRSLPEYNPTPSFPWKTESDLNYRFLSPCQTISLVGVVDNKDDLVDSRNPDSIIEAAQWDTIPSYTPIKQKFPLMIDCEQQYITQADLDHINQTYYFGQLSQPPSLPSQQLLSSLNSTQPQSDQHQDPFITSSSSSAVTSQHNKTSTQNNSNSNNNSNNSNNGDKQTTLPPLNLPPLAPLSIDPLKLASFDPLKEVYVHPLTYKCKKLVESNNEPVKSTYIVPNIASCAQGPLLSGSFVLGLGDVMLKVSPNITTGALLNMKYQRTHTAELCQVTYPIPHQSIGALVVPGSDQLRPIILDGVSQRQTSLSSLPIPSTAIPLYLYNSNFYNVHLRPVSTPNQLTIAWREFLDHYQCTALLLASVTSQKVSDALYFSETKRPIGFKQAGNRIVAIVEANYIQISNPMPITITQSAEDWYQLEDQRRAMITGDYTNTVTQLDEEGNVIEADNHGKEVETIPSIEKQQLDYHVDELLVNGCLLDRISSRKAVKERELNNMKASLTSLLAPLAQIKNNNSSAHHSLTHPSISSTTSNTNKSTSNLPASGSSNKLEGEDDKDLALSLDQRIDLATLYTLNPALFTSRNNLPNGVLAQYTITDNANNNGDSKTQSKQGSPPQSQQPQQQQQGRMSPQQQRQLQEEERKKKRLLTHSIEGYPLPTKQSERQELYDVRNQLLTHSYLDWLSDQPIVNKNNATRITNFSQKKNKNTNNMSGSFHSTNNNTSANSLTTTTVTTTTTTNTTTTNTTTTPTNQSNHSEAIPSSTNGGIVQLTPIHNPSDLSTYPQPPKYLSLELAGKSTDLSQWSHIGQVIPPNTLNPDNGGADIANGDGSDDHRTGRGNNKKVQQKDEKGNKIEFSPHAHAFEELSIHSKSFRCVKYRAHKRGYILGMDTEYDGALVITIATDYKIKVWYKGKLLCKYSNILGNLLCSSVVLIKRVGRVIYYSCCDGVYCVILPFDVVVDVIGTNMNTMMTALTVESGPLKPCGGKGFISTQLFNDVHSRGYTDTRFYTRSLHICSTDENDDGCCYRGVMKNFGNGDAYRKTFCHNTPDPKQDIRDTTTTDSIGTSGKKSDKNNKNRNSQQLTELSQINAPLHNNNDAIINIPPGDFNNRSLYEDVNDNNTTPTLTTNSLEQNHHNNSTIPPLEHQHSLTQLGSPQTELVDNTSYHPSSLSDDGGVLHKL